VNINKALSLLTQDSSNDSQRLDDATIVRTILLLLRDLGIPMSTVLLESKLTEESLKRDGVASIPYGGQQHVWQLWVHLSLLIRYIPEGKSCR
jgi:hypothetical protein